MIKSVVYHRQKLLGTHSNTMWENSCYFRQTTTDNQNISGDSAKDTDNKIEK